MTVCWNERRGLGGGGRGILWGGGGGACDAATRHHICMSVCLFVCMSFCLPACLPACLSVCLSVATSVYINININKQINKYIYIYIYAHPPPVDRPCPCDSVLLAGDSAEILYLNTHHTTIICIVDIQRVLLTCHVLRTHAPNARHMS